MTPSLPSRLSGSPLIEAIFEIRFSSELTNAGDVLPGLLYQALKSEYPEVQALPMAGVPRNIRASDPNFLYQPSHRLVGGKQAVQVGDRVISVSNTDYSGWASFLRKVQQVLDTTDQTKIVKTVERFSFRYINLIKPEFLQRKSFYELLNLEVTLMGQRPMERGFFLRTESDQDGFTTVVQVIANAMIQIGYVAGVQTMGMLIDIDTLNSNVPGDFLKNSTILLEQSHQIVKETFFSLLQTETISLLGPQE